MKHLRSRPTWLAVVALGMALIILTALLPGAMAGPSTTADFPAGQFALRVYYRDHSDLQALQGYDLWPVHNRAERYVIMGADTETAIVLRQQGWRVAVDQAATRRLAQVDFPRLFNDGYRTVAELVAAQTELAANYPGLVRLVDYGDSHCKIEGGCVTPDGETLAGHELLALRISNEAIAGASKIAADGSITRGDKPVFFLVANIHAREITTPEIAMRLAALLLEQYGIDPETTWLVDWHEIWIVPTANPDGHWLVELGAEPPYNAPFYQRKNLNNDTDRDGTSDCSQWPVQSYRHFGVDLNRNHSFAWGPPGSSDEPCNPTFRGLQSASEAETQALETLVRALIPDQRGEAMTDAAPADTTGLLITLHSYGNLVLWPWGFTTIEAPNRPDLKAIGDKLASLNGYYSCQPAQSDCLYGANGATDDWAYGELGIPAFTIEIGYMFMPPYDEIDSIQWPENRPALLHAAKLARAPYQTINGPEVRDMAVFELGNGLVRITATLSDEDNGGASIGGGRVSIGQPSWADGVTTIPMEPVDGAFDSPVEQAQAVVDLQVSSDPALLIFVEGQDTDGHWGVPGAVFAGDPLPPGQFALYAPLLFAR